MDATYPDVSSLENCILMSYVYLDVLSFSWKITDKSRWPKT